MMNIFTVFICIPHRCQFHVCLCWFVGDLPGRLSSVKQNAATQNARPGFIKVAWMLVNVLQIVDEQKSAGNG